LFYMAGGLYGYLLFLLLYRSGNDGTCMYRAKCLLSVLMADKGHFVTVHRYPVNVTAYAHLKSPGGDGAYALPP